LCCAALVALIVALAANPAAACFDTTELNATTNASEATMMLGVVVDYAGADVALTCAGEQAIVGVPSGDGLVVVGRLELASNEYVERQRLQPPVANETGMFGRAVAVDCRSGVLAVGEPMLNASSGATHVYERTSDDIADESATYELVATLASPSGPGQVALFGSALSAACAERVVAVGAPSYQSASGRVYVYEPDTSENASAAWRLVETIERPSDNVTAAMAEFGSALALSCDARRLVIGAPLDDGGGSVAVYRRDNASVPFALDRVLRQSDQMDAHFGRSVALARRGRIVTVGAPLYDSLNASLVDAGRVYQYDLDAEPPSDDERLAAPLEGTVGGARFGADVATSGDARSLVVGSASPTEPGSAMRFDYVESSAMYVVSTAAFGEARDPGLLGGAVASSFGGREFASTSSANTTLDANSTRVGVVDCWQRQGSYCPDC